MLRMMMSNSILVLGSSGTGKSSAIRTLNSDSTFVLGILDKPLPFKSYKNQYKKLQGWDDREGNYYSSDDWMKVLKCLKLVNDEFPHIKTIVIEDFNYLMANEFMRRACEKGYERFSEIAQHAWMVINFINSVRADLNVFVTCHNEIDATGVSKAKTVGKMLDDKISLEGLFSIVLHTAVIDGEYRFLTRNDGSRVAKSPMGMFDCDYIENDFSWVLNEISSYYGGC